MDPKDTDPKLEDIDPKDVDPGKQPGDADKDKDPDKDTDEKKRNREGYDQRKAAKEAEELRKELDGYKRREEDARKAKLTEEQRLKEDHDSLKAENERLKADSLRNKVAAEYKLPASLAARLIGSDEAAMRADAEELAQLLPKTKIGGATDPAKEAGSKQTFTRSQLRDRAFFLKNEAAIKEAYREGRIVEG